MVGCDFLSGFENGQQFTPVLPAGNEALKRIQRRVSSHPRSGFCDFAFRL
jgi:hypothetical protein